MLNRAYFDNAATTEPDPRVLELMHRVARDYWGNPGSQHGFGRAARRLLEDCRERIAQLLAVEKPQEILFTASATEANNLAIRGLGAVLPPERRRILASRLEHPSVVEPIEHLSTSGFHVDWVRVGADGRIDAEESRSHLERPGGLALLMAVNNETGVIQDTTAFFRACEEKRWHFHCDAVQAAGRLELAGLRSRSHSLTLSSHKVQGPRGAALLWLQGGRGLEAQLRGGRQERGRRSGTEDLPAIAGFAEALVLAEGERERRQLKVRELETELLTALREQNLNFCVNAATATRVPGLLSLRFPGQVAETLMMALDLEGFAVSLGSACASGSAQASPVLRAMGLALEDNHASLRVSLSHRNEAEELRRFVTALGRLLRR